MTDHVDSLDDPSADELDAIQSWIARDEMWTEPPEHLENAVIAAIATEAGVDWPPVVSLAARRRTRRSPIRWLGAAAAVAMVVAGTMLLTRGSDDGSGVTFALAGTEAAPDASAEAIISTTPAGMKILLDTNGLPGAPDGYMYEAWVSDGAIRVSAGTFHLRGGDGQIELWAGVVDPTFRTLSVTLEPIDGVAETSRDARLVGDFTLDD